MSLESLQAQAQATPEPFQAGSIAIVGRPNVGKSTLLNRLIGQKLSITSRKAQTTRHRITGILTEAGRQFVFVDTPGFQTTHRSALNRVLNRTVQGALADVDVVLFVLEAGRFGPADQAVLDQVPEGVTTVLVLNKADRVRDRAGLLEFTRLRASERDYAAIVPVSAKTGSQCEDLLNEIARHLPQQPALYDEELWTDRNERFLVSELIREKVFRQLGDELPYTCTVVIEQFKEEPADKDPSARFCHIEATILVARPGHKAMIIGQGGAKLKEIGSEARADIERLLMARVHLGLWVKVKEGWNDNEAGLRAYGYE